MHQTTHTHEDGPADEREILDGDSDSGGGLLSEPTTRRSFLQRAALLSLAIPGAGSALTAYGDEAHAPAQRADLLHNPDSKLDKELHRKHGHATTTKVEANAADVKFEWFDPTLPPPPKDGVLNLHWHAQQTPIRISSDTVVSAWTFEHNTPGPLVHCRVGDTVNFTLTNDMYVPHSMDFHAAQIDPETAFRSAPKGGSVSYSFKPRHAGVFLYHCGTAPVLMHIGAGMLGALVVSPREPLPPAREFVLVQNEFYLGDAINGVRPFDYSKMLSVTPQIIAFNGRPGQYSDRPLHVKVGERVRFWVANAGPTVPCAFHIVGEQFETVYLGAPPGSAIHGVQTFSVAPGGGMCFELDCLVPGNFVFVNHAFGHGQKGAIGHLVVDG